MSLVCVHISNGYACGRESESAELLPEPPPVEVDEEGVAENLFDWWQEVVHPRTGDGHPCGSRENGWHEAVIAQAPGRPELVGQTFSWEG